MIHPGSWEGLLKMLLAALVYQVKGIVVEATQTVVWTSGLHSSYEPYSILDCLVKKLEEDTYRWYIFTIKIQVIHQTLCFPFGDLRHEVQ